jgi:hypothetical protein
VPGRHEWQPEADAGDRRARPQTVSVNDTRADRTTSQCATSLPERGRGEAANRRTEQMG